MTLSYAMLSDQAARDFIIASATAGTAVTGGLLVSVAKVAARLNVAINDAGVDYVLVNDQDKIGLLSTTAASVPAFLEDFVNIKPGAFIGTTAVAAGTIIVGNKNAGEFKELPGLPDPRGGGGHGERRHRRRRVRLLRHHSEHAHRHPEGCLDLSGRLSWCWAPCPWCVARHQSGPFATTLERRTR
jgi:hypothetical protein